MHSVLGNHKTMIHQYTVIVVIHVYNRIIVFTQQRGSILLEKNGGLEICPARVPRICV